MATLYIVDYFPASCTKRKEEKKMKERSTPSHTSRMQCTKQPADRLVFSVREDEGKQLDGEGLQGRCVAEDEVSEVLHPEINNPLLSADKKDLLLYMEHQA